jgi:hypothetical protein
MDTNNQEHGSRSSAAVASRGADFGIAEGAATVSPNQPPGATGAGIHETAHAHEGSFASGQRHPERPARRGDFAEGQERQKLTYRGGFAEGQRAFDRRQEQLAYRGDFAAGQRRSTRTAA